MTAGGAPVSPVDTCIKDAVERHGGRPSRHHGDDDPGKPPGQVFDREAARAPRQQRSRQRERQREHGVLKLNHVERKAKTCPEGLHLEVTGSGYAGQGARRRGT